MREAAVPPEADRIGRPQTWLEKVGVHGEVQLVTLDPDMARKALLARSVDTFVYWDGEKEDRVVGHVKERREEDKMLHFVVWPEEAGAHAI